MFSSTSPSLLSRLIDALRRVPIMPVPGPRPERSMLTFEDAASIVEKVISQGQDGTLNAADPQLFTFDLLKEALRQAGTTLYLMPLPSFVFAAAGMASARLRDSLFSSNVLQSEANYASKADLPVGIERAIADLARGHVRD